MKTGFQYDVFLSHNKADKSWVRGLYSLLKDQSLEVFFDEESIDFGDDTVAALDKALDKCRHILLVVTPHSMASRWVALETSVSIYADPNAAAKKLIPILLEPTPREQIPATVRRLNTVDLTNPSNRTARLKKLLKQLGISVTDRLELPAWPSGGSDWLASALRSTVASVLTDLCKEKRTAAHTAQGDKEDTEALDDPLVETAGNDYTKVIERRYNLVRVFGMDRPIPLRNIYVRVNILKEVTASRRLTVSDLERDFDFDRHGFGIRRTTWEGTELVERESYKINKDVKNVVLQSLKVEAQATAKARLEKLESKAFGSTESLLAGIFEVTRLSQTPEQEEALARLGHEPPQNYIVLGKPGAGKTTFLKYLTLHLLDGNAPFCRVPIFVTLRDFADSGLDLLAFIVREFQQCQLPKAADVIEKSLKDGRMVALLDGLDEVSVQQQDKVIREIVNLSERFLHSQFIVSCRVAAYNHWFTAFSDIEIADFSPEQISAFVFNWFHGELETGRNCLKSIEERRQTMELASNPLLLTLLCIAYDQTLGFPKNRAELYREAIDALLKKWDASRRIKRDDLYKNLSLRRKESLLCRIATETFERGQYFIPRRELESLVTKFISNLPSVDSADLPGDSEAVIKSVEGQHGVLVERARGIYSFSHLTFQEYFTAKYYVENLRQTINATFITKAMENPRWREVCLLTCGLLDQADEFFVTFKEQVDGIAQHSTVSRMLNRLMEISAPMTQYPAQLRRCLLLIYTVHHAQAVISGEKTEFQKTEFQKCLEHLYTIAAVLDRGVIRRAESGRYLEYATQLVHDTEFTKHLADDAAFCLRRVLTSSKASRLQTDGKGRAFPIGKLAKYTVAHSLMLECLVSDCYIDKQLREDLMKSALSIKGAGHGPGAAPAGAHQRLRPRT